MLGAAGTGLNIQSKDKRVVIFKHIDVFLTVTFSYGQRCQHFEVIERLFADYGLHRLFCAKVTTFEKMTV